MSTEGSLRRSRRNIHKSTESYQESSDSESESDPDHSDNDVAYTFGSSTKTKRNKQPSKKSKNKSKSRSTSKSSSNVRKSLEQLEEELQENELYLSLAQPEIDIVDIAIEWVDTVNQDLNEGIETIINLILRSCGSLHLFQAHDLINLESASETVAELTIAFGDQQAHKYPFKTLSIFRKNVLDFFEQVIQISHDRGLLYLEDQQQQQHSLSSPMMIQLLTWISTLSSCTIRPLRYVSTIILLSIQDRLCHIISKVNSSLERSQRQLSTTKKSNKAKYNSISKTINNYHFQKNTIIEYFNEIGNITLGHRYRDIDPLIRIECIKYLSQAMIIYPDHFFQATFLRYFGWLLSDPTNTVRVEITKVLLKLYKHNTSNSMIIGFRQFTERYKKQIIKMINLDSDINVRLNSISICCEFQRFGFIDQIDNAEVINFYYQLITDSSKKVSKSNNLKLKSELSKYISIANNQLVNDLKEKYSIFIQNYKCDIFDIQDEQIKIDNCFKIKSLIELLHNSQQIFISSLNNSEIELEFYKDFEAKNVISIVFESLYQLPFYHNTLEFLIHYLLLDVSSLKFESLSNNLQQEESEIEEFKKSIDLSNNEIENRQYLLAFIKGALDNLLDNPNKSKIDELSSTTFVRLAEYIPNILSISIKSPKLLSNFLQIWNKLIYLEVDAVNISTVFGGLNKKDSFNEINNKLLEYFDTFNFQQDVDNELIKRFDLFLNRLLQDYNKPVSNINLISSEIRVNVQKYIRQSIDAIKNSLNYIPDENNQDSTLNDYDEDFKTLKITISYLVEISEPIFKLRKYSDYINLSENFPDVDLLIDLITYRIISVFEIKSFFNSESSVSYFNLTYPKLINNFKNILDFILIGTSWKIEKLIEINDKEQQKRFDIDVEFNYLFDIIESISKVLDKISQGIKIALENINKFSNENESIDKLYSLKTLFAVKLIDLLVSVKIFYIKNNEDNAFNNFNEFFTNPKEMGKFISEKIPSEVQFQLLDNFLYKESKLAKNLSIDLDRDDDEDVNYNDLVAESQTVSHEENQRSSIFDDSDNSDVEMGTHEKEDSIENNHDSNKNGQEKAKELWKSEKELCVYIVKLFSLINSSIVHSKIRDRINLNSHKIGGIYEKLVKSEEASKEIENGIEQQQKENTTSASDVTNNNNKNNNSVAQEFPGDISISQTNIPQVEAT
ncbi:uncharacterized protein RJT21DRAFT_117014 [Scheffersomyces amazonensis]|uniref:uncharacterized protein n=1 Tax=Scheffersomyces amazonensis TaxID=1078765 RepID=UPI00315C6DB5